MTTTGVMRQSTGWTVSDTTFAARLALVRMRMGWNMKEAARECGLNAQTWRLWEIDGALPRNHVQVAKQISTRTGCDYLWLLLGPEGGGGEFKGRLDPLAERVIGSRSVVRSSPVQPAPPPGRPTQRRARPLRSPNRVERVAA